MAKSRRSKYTPEERKKLRAIVVQIISGYRRGADLEPLCLSKGLALKVFYGLLSTFELGERFRAAKADHKRNKEQEDEPEIQVESEVVYDKNDHIPSVIPPQTQVQYFLDPGLSDAEKCSLVLDHYLANTQKSLVDCIFQGALTETAFFLTVAGDNELSEKKAVVKELRDTIVSERLEFEKNDALNHTTREIFKRVREGNVSSKKKIKVVSEKMFDRSGNYIGTKEKREEEMVEDHIHASVTELRAALSLIKVGTSPDEIPEAAIEADALEFNPDLLPDLVDQAAEEANETK